MALKQERILRTAEMRVFINVTRRPILNRQRNKAIRDMCKDKMWPSYPRQRRCQWNARVARMTLDRLPKIVKNGKPQIRRLVDKPPKRWENSYTSYKQQN